VGAAGGEAAHQLDRVVDIDVACRDRFVLAGAHAGNGGTQVGGVPAPSGERPIVGAGEVERHRSTRAARRGIGRYSGGPALPGERRSDEAVAPDDQNRAH